LKRAVSDRSCVLVVAQLFGGHFALDDILAVCRENGLKLVEDCAQTFGGAYAGHPEADISLFSFGPLKTRTALAGALMTVRDGATRDRMAALQAAYPEMGRADFAQRVLKYAVIRYLCMDARRWGRLCDAIARSGRDPNAVIRGWTRSLSGAFRIERFRVRPGAPLLRLLARRLREGDPSRWVARRTEVGAKLAERLDGVEHLGAACRAPLHWLFPVVVSEPAGTLARLFAGGFQAAPGLSNLDTFAPPADRPETTPVEARRILNGALILPMHPSLSDTDLDRLPGMLVSSDVSAEMPVASAV
jgi:dTDP-4-amino-4,6-dideoxygalactose transaminase